MTKLPIEKRAYDLVVAGDWFYYGMNCTPIGGERLVYFKHDLQQEVAVTAAEYNQAKYHAPIEPYQAGESVCFMANGDTLRCAFQDSVVRQFGPAGELLRELPYSSIEAHMGIYSIALDVDGNLWTADPAYHHVAQYDVATAQKLWELGGSWDLEPSELNYPEEVVCYGPDIFISDMGHCRLLRLNTRTKALSTYASFSQQVWEYRRFGPHELVRLQDGIYVL